MKKSQSLCRIYSRNRFNFFKPKRPKFNFNRKRTSIFIIIIVAVITFLNLYKGVMPVFETLCKDEAISMATKITNEQTTTVMANYSYTDLFTIEKDDSRKYPNDKCKYFKN